MSRDRESGGSSTVPPAEELKGVVSDPMDNAWPLRG